VHTMRARGDASTHMRIAIDATESFWPQLTGTGVYTRQLLRQFQALSVPEQFVVLGIRAANIDTSFISRDFLRLLRSPRYRTVWSQVRLPLHLLANRYDLLHVPGHKLPAFCPCRSVATILDLAVLRFPETFRPLHRQRLLWFTRNAARRADRLIAISESTKRDLCEQFGTPAEKIDVVHLGVDHEVFHADVSPATRPVPYVLSVGTLQPRKNYVMLIRAFNRLCEGRCKEIELLIAGQRGWMYEEIEAEAKKSPFASRIHLLGYVSDEMLPPLYTCATLVAMPSLYEGFGLPLLEAMACGAPVIASNVSSFPEVAGDAAMLLDPNEPDAWAEAMRELLGNKEKRRELRQRAIARAQLFSWEQTAERTLEVYRKAAKQ
jgi:glycosyltransferase involved in cell wall biosynthesis